MSKVTITVGGNIEKESSQRFVDVRRQASRGKAVRERHLAFENWAALSRVLTGKRPELLHHVRHNKVASVRGLAKALDRDYSDVHADVRYRKQGCSTSTRPAYAPTTTRSRRGSQFDVGPDAEPMGRRWKDVHPSTVSV